MLYKLINCYQMLERRDGDDQYLLASLINAQADITKNVKLQEKMQEYRSKMLKNLKLDGS